MTSYRSSVQGQSPLHGAATNQQIDITEKLLSTELALELDGRDNNGYTPLLTACASGKIAVVKTLVEHGADFHARTNKGFSALHLAVQSGNPELTKFVLALHEDSMPRSRDESCDPSLQHSGIEEGDKAIINMPLQILRGFEEAKDSQNEIALDTAAGNDNAGPAQ
ncbi:ankyrin repeat-containing domain protein [Podospora fimiseda]|uniref:Ankyrin repeat-containing domain protein n=1 Tax=Podospora fimiseda TaxID=252190 RepID=A0AAN7BPU6_9PEZI|nr:ankyrin repeat-containing domain protein [Podospora fimiseda]